MNTIPNVPRELLEAALSHPKTPDEMLSKIKAAEELRAILSAPSPAGVDGDFGWLVNLELPEVQCNCQWNPDSHDKTCPVYLRDRLSDAQAIIDVLRGEVAEERAKVAQLEEGIPRIIEASYQFRQQRDQQAHRIGELEGLLYEASGELRTDRHHGLRPRIDAALSAGKEGE